MYAIAEIKGSQIRLEENKYVYVPLLDKKPDEVVSFDKILMFECNAQVFVGAPFLENVSIQGTVLANVRADKVIVFKKKRRKGYRKKLGHRQGYSKVLVNKIISNL